MSRRRRKQVEVEEQRFAVLCSLVVNYSMRAPEEPCKPEQFLSRSPSAGSSERRDGSAALTDETRAEIAESFRRLFGSSSEGS